MALNSGAKCVLDMPQCYCSLQKFLDNMDSCIHDGEGRGCKKKLGSGDKTDAYLYVENVFCREYLYIPFYVVVAQTQC